MNKASFYHTDEDAISNGGGVGKGDVASPPQWRSTVVLLPPGTSIDNPLTLLPSGLPSVLLKLGLSGVKKMLLEFEGGCKAARKAGLRKGEDPYYLFFVGTAAAQQGQGLGFELVREIVVGEGRVGKGGLVEKGGEGVRIWAMVWRPEGKK